MTTYVGPSDDSGRKIGPYQILEPLGKGGMAEVFRAYQTGVDRYVAVKVILPHLAADETFVARFRREVRIITRLEHPNIVPVYDFGAEKDGTLYLVMRLVEGGSLEGRLLTNGRLPLREITRKLGQITSALDYAHRNGVVHRDLKPSNVLLDEQGNAYLTDFGIAKLTETDSHNLTNTGTVVGTPEYMSPEQWRGDPLDGRSDIYALGVMLYRMLVGEVPFRGTSIVAVMNKHINEPTPSACAVRSDLPAAVDEVLKFALAKETDKRYANAEELYEAFQEAVRGTASRQTTTPFATEAIVNALPGAAPATPGALKTDAPEDTTHIDINSTKAGRTQGAARAKRTRPRPLVIFGALALLVLIVGGIILASGGGLPGSSLSGLAALPSGSPTATVTASSTVTFTPSHTPLPTNTPTAAPTMTLTSSLTNTLAPTTITSDTTRTSVPPSATSKVTPSRIPPTLKPIPTTLTPIPTVTYTATRTPILASLTPTLTLAPTLTSTPIPPSVTPTFSPTVSPTPSITLTSAPSVTAGPTNMSAPIATRTAGPSATVNAAAIAAQQLSYGDTVNGVIDEAHVSSPPWKFFGHYGDRLLINVQRSNPTDTLIPVIHVLDEAGQAVDWSDNSANKNILETVPLPKDGTYQIVVSRLNTINGTTLGGYTLNLTLARAGTQPSATPTPSLTPSHTFTPTAIPTLTPSLTSVRNLYYGQSVAGILPLDTAADQWTFNGATGDNIDVRTADALNGGRVFTVTLTGPGIVPPGNSSPQGALGGVTLTQNGTFTIQISGKAGQYQLTLGGKAAQATPVLATTNVLKFGAPIVRQVLNDNKPEADWQFTGHTGDLITLSVTADGTLDPVLELIDPNGKSLAINDDVHGNRDAGLEHFRLPADGVYKVKITRYQGTVNGGVINGGQYTVLVTLEPPIIPPLFSYPTSQLLLDPHEDLLQYGDTRDGTLTGGAEHVYVFLGRVGDIIGAKVQTKSGDLEPALRLTDDIGTVIYTSNQEEHGLSLDQIQPRKLARNGRYTLTVSTKSYRSNGGAYRLDLLVNSANPKLTPDKPVKDLINAENTQQVFYFDGQAGEYIQLVARPGLNSQLDPYLILLAPNGRLITFTSSGSDRSATLTGIQLGESGRYAAIVTHMADTVGEFNLSLSLLPSAPSAPWQAPTIFALSGTHPNGLLAGECPNGANDTWGFSGSQDDVITLGVDRLYGEGLPSLAGVIGPDGNPVASLSGSENGPQAKYHLPATGDYQVRVAGQHCQYTLYGHWQSNQKPLSTKIDYTNHDANKLSGTLPANTKVAVRFDGKTSDNVSALIYWTNVDTVSTALGISISWITPDGTAKPINNNNPRQVSYSQILPMSGTYTINIQNNSSADATLNIELRADVPQPTATPITTDLSSGQVLITQPNATGGAIYQFFAHAGERVHLALEVPSNQSPALTVLQPDGKPLDAKVQIGSGYNTLDAALSQNGQYTVIISNASNKPLRFTFSLVDAAAPATPTVQITAGAPVPPIALNPANASGTFSAVGSLGAGNTAIYSFDGIAGQNALVSLFVTPPSVTMPTPGLTVAPAAAAPVYMALTLFDPDGQYVAESSTADGLNRALPVLHAPLTKTGKYTVEIRARGAGKLNSPFYLTVVVVAPNATATPVALNTLPFEHIQKATLTVNGAVTWQFAPTRALPLTLFVVRPAAGTNLRASIDLYTLDGFWEGTATAAAQGDDVRLLIPLTSVTPYRIVVHAIDKTSGDYTIYAAGNPAGIVVFGTGRLTVIPYKGPNPNKYPADRALFGDNYEAFAQSADGQWLELRDPVTHHVVWVRRDKVQITYGQNNVTTLPVDQPTK